MSFDSLSLSPALIQALPSQFSEPTAIQRLVIPDLLSLHDVLALANTGSGKTLAYGLPLIQLLSQSASHAGEDKNAISHQALILVPTRELAQQVTTALAPLAKASGLEAICLCGGVDKAEQQQALKVGAQVIVATTGRLLDFVTEGVVNLANVNHLVLDEADRLLDMGFWKDVQAIAKLTSPQRQTALFSATFSDELESNAAQIQNNPKRITAHQKNSVTEQVSESLFLVNKGSKPNVLIELVRQHQWSQVLVFIGAKENADKLTKKLVKAGISASALHGNKSQQEREQTLAEFKKGTVSVLIATDLLARGIDISDLPVVVNFELPQHAEVYVHRVGRTARAGKKGMALSLVCHGEMAALDAIRALTERTLPLQTLDNFPVTDTPSTGESKRAPRDKKANRRTQNKNSSKQFQGKPRKR
ncbi:DEAD/DEAH box helicase [Vibrio ulleungensis]|uniref:DEAD/DEAH box helicase n=1 Tax=Vibrio ulleungensis TaxID=2807619 RepID=A0ABS2HB33_9VIBR|nr:DEAD/DEAH box helicase [Vibrio ulleungensis]MBM7034815.1 DEAD/DEAH box helicase [Vibrio ulleungensis]